MHDIEPHFQWRDRYRAEDDSASPFYGRQYSEFSYSNKVYNYLLHPQWDEFGSETLYLKILFVDYDDRYAIIELIGEWNDALHNDSMWLKREVIDYLVAEGITEYILIMEGVLNFHSDTDDYYEEWYQEITEAGGWIAMVNVLDHVADTSQVLLFTHHSQVAAQAAEVIDGNRLTIHELGAVSSSRP